MRPAQGARKQLNGQWLNAVQVQLLIGAAGLLLLALEVAAVRLAGLDFGEAVHLDLLLSGQSSWLHGVIVLGTVLADLLLTSPLRIGQAAYYARLASGAHPAVRSVWKPYKDGYYWLSVQWRLAIWWRRLAWGVLYFAPSALVVGYGEVIRRNGFSSPLAEITILFCGLFGLFLLIAGFVALQLTMLRYMPAQYFLTRCGSVRAALRTSRGIMSGRTGEMAWLYAGFAGWLFTCVLALPYFYASPLFLTTRAGEVMRVEQRRADREVVKMVNRRRTLLPNGV